MPGKFKDRNGHTRWQEAKGDIKAFVQEHKDEILPIVKAIVKTAAPPRVTQLIQAIDEIKASRLPAKAKETALQHINSLLDDTDDEGDEIALATSTEDMPGVDLTKVVNSTWLSKYITPVFTVLTGLQMVAMYVTNLAAKWGVEVMPYNTAELAEISILFGSMFGVRQIIRNEQKKKILAP